MTHTNRWLFVVMAVSMLSGLAIAQTQTTTESSILTKALYVAPYPILNLVGLGAGSYLQGDIVAGVVLSATDIVLATLFVLTATEIVAVPDELGYIFLLGRSLPAVILPVVDAFRSGTDADSLVAPILFNLLPGLGLGSLVQGDIVGAETGALFDVIAVVAYLAGGIAALYPNPYTYNADSIGLKIGVTLAIGSAVAGRVIGVIRPIVFRQTRNSQ